MEAGGRAPAAGSSRTHSCGCTLCSAACTLLTGLHPCRGLRPLWAAVAPPALPALRGALELALGALSGSSPGCEVWVSVHAPKSSMGKYPVVYLALSVELRLSLLLIQWLRCQSGN